MHRPVPTDWPDVFDPEAAEAVIAVTLEEHGNAAGIVELVVELRWAIAQLRAERALANIAEQRPATRTAP